MNLKEIETKLTEEFKIAMKEKNNDVKAVISIIKAKLKAAAKDAELKGKEFTESDIMTVFSQELKQTKESIAESLKAVREDAVEAYTQQKEFLEKFLPKQLNKEEIKTKVIEIIAKIGLEIDKLTPKDMGKIMKEANTELKGKADGKEVSSVVSELIKK